MSSELNHVFCKFCRRLIKSSSEEEIVLGFHLKCNTEDEINIPELSNEEKTIIKELEKVIQKRIFPVNKYGYGQSEFITKDSYITSIRLFKVNLSHLPDSIQKLQYLEELIIEQCDLPEFPDFLPSMTQLTRVIFHMNKIRQVPSNIDRLVNLRELAISANPLNSIPESIGNLTNLEVLGFSHNYFRTVPESIGNLTNLYRLDLDLMDTLKSIPESIGNLEYLKILQIRNNRSLTGKDYDLGVLPDSIGTLINLEELGLGLYKYPESITNLPI